MNFANVKEWYIPDGSVRKVTNSQGKIIWQKQTYTMLDRVTVDTNKTGVIVPLNIPAGHAFEILMDYDYTGDPPTATAVQADTVHLMGTGECYSGKQYITGLSKNSNYDCDSWFRINTSGTYRSIPNSLKNNSTLANRRIIKNWANTYSSSGSNSDRSASATGHISETLYDGTIIYSFPASSLDASTFYDHNLTYESNIYDSSTKIRSFYFNDINSYWGFGLFANSDGTVYLPNYGKFIGDIYECYIKVDGEYTCRLLPAQDDITKRYGLYDTVNEIFYPSCTENEFTYIVPITTNLTLDGMNIAIGSTKRITRTITPVSASQNLTWSSSDQGIATVDQNGNVTATSYGNVTITATTTDGSNISATCNVFCYVPTTGISLNPTYVQVTEGGSARIVPTVTPSNATYKDVTWTYNDLSYISLTKNSDQSATITGLEITPRTRFIHAKTHDGQQVSCKYDVVDSTVHVSSVSVSPSTAEVVIGETITLSATINPSDASNPSITWSSSDTSIATVEQNGVVTGVGIGTATITATSVDGNRTDTCAITVKDVSVHVSGVSISPTSVTMYVGDTRSLSAIVTPSNASNKSVVWRSYSPSIASVSSTGIVYANKAGMVRIEVTTNDGGYTAYLDVSVLEIPVSSVSVYPETLTLGVGNTAKLSATVSPSNAGNKNVSWSSSNSSIATVDSNGTVTGVATGSCTITATTQSGNKTDTCIVTVQASIVNVTGVTVSPTTANLNKDETLQLSATVSPSNATNKTVNWDSSDTLIATVNSTGLVTAKKSGTVRITATTVDGNKTAYCDITVVTPVTGVNISQTTASMQGTDILSLSASVVPSNADNKQILWHSSNTNVATVTSEGYVSSIGVGTCTIYATSAADSTKYATCTVSVSRKVALDKYSVTLNVGETTTLTASCSPGSITGGWQSSNTNVVTLDKSLASIPGTVTLTAVGAGTATVYYNQSSGHLLSCTVTVSEQTPKYNLVNNTGAVIYFTGYPDIGTAVELNPGSTITVLVASALYIRTSDAYGYNISLQNISSVQTTEFGGYTWYYIPANVVNSGINIIAYN